MRCVLSVDFCMGGLVVGVFFVCLKRTPKRDWFIFGGGAKRLHHETKINRFEGTGVPGVP